MSIERKDPNVGYSIVIGNGRSSDSIQAYSILDGVGDKVLLLFQNEDDAERYAIMLRETEPLQAMDYRIIEIDVRVVSEACINLGYKYTLVDSNDLVVPPL